MTDERAREREITVLVDALGIEPEKTGVSQYSIQLLRHMIPLDHHIRYVILIRPFLETRHEIFKLESENPNVRFLRADIPPIGLGRDLKFLLSRRRWIYDLYHCLNSNLPLTMNRGALVTIHDLKYVLFPGYLGRFSRIKAAYLIAVFRHAVRKAKRIIAVSDSTREDLVRLFGQRDKTIGQKIRTIPEAASVEKVEDSRIVEKYRLKSRYFLYVGELRPHKNVEGLIRAFEQLIGRRGVDRDLRLLIVGKKHRSFRIPEGTSERVAFVGYVPDQQLYTFYRHAVAFCLVSFYEGFGLPILEAMESGAPVITSNLSSMKEVAGDAALLVSPHDPTAIAEAMYRLYFDDRMRESLIERGRTRVEGFSWLSTARKTLELYRDAARLQRRGVADRSRTHTT